MACSIKEPYLLEASLLSEKATIGSKDMNMSPNDIAQKKEYKSERVYCNKRQLIREYLGSSVVAILEQLISLFH